MEPRRCYLRSKAMILDYDGTPATGLRSLVEGQAGDSLSVVVCRGLSGFNHSSMGKG